ncbi:MAG TPA: HepT-like ribonuclease domain-containing protein [Thermoanaerobaculia bacterium]|jgi:uncharacterized protein with HEPN domain
MTKHSDEKYFDDMLVHARKAVALVGDRDRNSFQSDEALRYGVTHLIQIVGEAASRISPDARATADEFPWADIINMRHRLVHDYGNIDDGIVWDTAIRDLPRVIAALETRRKPRA